MLPCSFGSAIKKKAGTGGDILKELLTRRLAVKSIGFLGTQHPRLPSEMVQSLAKAVVKGASWSRDVTPPLRDVKKTDIFGRLKCLLPCVKCLKAHDKWRQCGTLPLACPLELGTRNTDPGNSSSKLASGWPILNKPRTESMIMSIAGPFAVWPPCPSRQILMVS